MVPLEAFLWKLFTRRYIVYTLVELETIDSTNNWAKREKASFSPDHSDVYCRFWSDGRPGKRDEHLALP